MENCLTESKRFRSRLSELPLDLKCEIAKVAYQKGMLPTSRRNKVNELLKQSGIEFREVGTGTNRYIINYDGYAIKIALDKEGIADNKIEWVQSERLTNVAKSYEISSNGNLLVAQYAPAFSSWGEMQVYSSQIRQILNQWSKQNVLGDVGITSVNYANWGLLNNSIPVCIDYAYVLPVDYKIFRCYCGSTNVRPDHSFTCYTCADCKQQFTDRDFRMRVSQSYRDKLFDDTKSLKVEQPETFIEVPVHEIPEILKNPDYPDLMELARFENRLTGAY